MQKEVYENTVKFLIDEVLQSYNSTVFAYGATAAGKTYTYSQFPNQYFNRMLGTKKNLGIMPRAIEDLMKRVEIDSVNHHYNLKLSYLEIYNENIRDLLATNSGENLPLREDPVEGVVVSELIEIVVSTLSDINSLLRFVS